MQIKIDKENAFTLPELMISVLILGITFVGMLLTFVKCMDLNELSRNSMIAVAAAKTKAEDIKNSSFNTIYTNYNAVPFDVTGFAVGTAKGVSYVDNTNPDLLLVTISICWKQKSGRTIGEDTNVNGILNAGEDKDADNAIDSPVQVVSYIYQH